MKGVRFAEAPIVSTPFFERKGTNGVMSTPGMLGAQTPAQVSPDENEDRKNLAGRTPHNKKLEVTKNMELFHKQLFGGDIAPSTPAGKNKWALEVTSTPSEKSTNVSVISPDPADDSNNSPAPLTPYKAELLFGSSESPESVSVAPHSFASQHSYSPAPVVATEKIEKVGFIIPVKDESARKNFPKKIQSTPYVDRPVFKPKVPSMEDNDEPISTPNVSIQQSERSTVYTPVICSAPSSMMVSPIPMQNSFVVSPAQSSKNNSQLENEGGECVKSLFESPISSSVPPVAVVLSEIKEMVVDQLPEPQATPANFVQELKKESPTTLIPVVTSIDFLQQQQQPVVVSPIKEVIPGTTSYASRDPTSPMLLHRAGGVAKGRGPSSTAASFAATVAYITAPQAASTITTAATATATSFVSHELVVPKKVVVHTEASEPMGQPALAFTTSPAARKLVPELLPKKADFACSPITIPGESQQQLMPQTPSPLKQMVNMCNVSIQTSLVLDTIKSVATAPLKPVAAAFDASSMVHSPAAASTAPLAPYSPMFTSYFAAHPDSDSEAEEMENLENALDDCALMDLIGGGVGGSGVGITQLHSSPLSNSKLSVKLNSSLNNTSFRSTGSVGGARRVSISEHQRLQAEAEESDDDCLPVLLGSSFPTTALPEPSTVKTVSPVRSVPIAHRPPVHFDTQLFLKEEEQQQQYLKDSSKPFSHEKSVSFLSDLDMLDATDAAVKLHNDSELHFSDNEEVEGLQFVGQNTALSAVVPAMVGAGGLSFADYSTAETTMTLDQAVDDSFASGEAHLGQPRLAIQSMKRDKQALPDMKEVILQCAAGAFTTTVLHFSNRQTRPLSLKSQTIQIRYEPVQSSAVSDITGLSYFKVSPSELNILPGEDNQLYITFSPPKGACGTYSGVIKIRSNKKSFTMLLRGEASVPAPVAVNTTAPVLQKPVTIPTAPVHFEDPHVESFSLAVDVPTPKVVERPFRSSAVEEIYRRNIQEAAAQPAYFAMQTETLLQQRQRNLQQRIQELKKRQDSPKNAAATASFFSSSRNFSVGTDVKSVVASAKVASTPLSPVVSSGAVQSPPANASVLSVSVEGLSVAEESVSIRQMGDSNQFEGSLTLRNDSTKASLVTVSTSASCLKCFKSSYKVSARSSVNVRIMLDGNISELQQICRRVSQSSDVSRGSNLLGFITIRMDNQEFNVEAILPHSLCGVIHRLYSTSLVSVPTPTASTVYAVNAVRHNSSSVVEASQLNSSAEATMSVDVTKVDIHSGGKQIKVNGGLNKHSRRQRSGSSSDEVDESYTTTATTTTRYQQHESYRGKYSVDCHQSTTADADLKKEGTYAAPNKVKSSTDKKEKNRSAHSSNGGHGVYFRLGEARFGSVTIGSLTRTRIDLCNGTDNEVTVYLSDPALPFVLLPVHSEIHLRPRSYVRVPLRFIPVAEGEFNEQLVAQTSDGSYQTVISLSGFASERK